MKILHRADAAYSSHYYAEQKDDYYSRDGNSAVWQGAGAAMLGLTGEVDPARFKQILAGDFGLGIQVTGTVRRDANARAGLDLTISAPKSVTLQALVAGDARVVAAHDKAVEAALAYVEKELAMGRIKVGGKAYAEQTGNLVIAKFRHETARPTRYAQPDPQLHTHAIIANLTRRSDGAWVSLSNEEIVRLQRLIDAHYMSELAAGLEKIGYEIRFEANHIELAHYTRAQIEAFSRRSLEINRALHQLGLDRTTASRAQKAVIALQTRMSKDAAGLSREEQQAQWREQAVSVGMDLDGWKRDQHSVMRPPEIDLEAQPNTAAGAHDIGTDPDLDESVSPNDQDDFQDFPNPEAPEQPIPAREDEAQHLGSSSDTDSPSAERQDTPETAPAEPGYTPWDVEHPDDGDWPRSESPAPADESPAESPAPGAATPALPPVSPTAPAAETTGQPQSSSRRDYVAIQAVRWAIKHLSEREAVMSESAILESALRHAGGRATLASLQHELQATVRQGTLLAGAQTYTPADDLKSRPLTREAWIETIMLMGHDRAAASRMVTEGIITGRLVAAEPQFTTAKARQREIDILDWERAGRDTLEPLMEANQIQVALQNEPLLPGQRQAAGLILGSRNRVVGVQGLAGAGKSHMLERTRGILEARGLKMVAVAAYGSQVRALRALGVEASTIASRLEASNKKRFSEKIDEKTVLVVDEAGVVPARLMIRIMKMAEQAGARLVLLGDTGQTPAIEAGKPFAQLQRAGMATAVMGDIIRQKNPVLKAAVELAAAGRAKTSLSRIEEIQEVKDNSKRYGDLAARYAQMSPADRAETLIVTGTNVSRNAINDACHEQLGLAGRGRDYTLLTRRDTTQAERRYAKYYAVGDIIQPERDYACGLARGAMYEVTGAADNHQLRVRALDTGEVIDFLPSRTQKLSVYEPLTAELSVGDWVRVTRNNAELDLSNGDRFLVTAVSPTEVVISARGRSVSLPANGLLHLDRAYATTVHSAQGLTCDRVLINAESYSRTTKRDVFYVGISRARYEAVIFTDDRKKLPAAVARHEEKSAALDLVPNIQKDRELEKPAAEPQFGRQ